MQKLPEIFAGQLRHCEEKLRCAVRDGCTPEEIKAHEDAVKSAQKNYNVSKKIQDA